jgi:hypothetical protein
MRNKHITLELAGGLGNQLFGYFAGIYMAQATNRKLTFETSSINLARVGGTYSINSFQISRKANFKLPISRFGRLRVVWLRIRDFVYFRSNRIRTISNHFFSIIEDEGFDKNLEVVLSKSENRNIYLKGYFQDFTYFDRSDAESKILNLRNPSQEFKNLALEISTTDSITMHIRLGDFKENIETIGVLSSDYYRDAISALDKPTNSDIWVFSDDIEEAREICKNISNHHYRFVELPPNSDPAESLVLISMGTQIITSNSTFSLWAAKLSQDAKKIICPSFLMRQSNYKVKHLPTSWTLIDPNWMD